MFDEERLTLLITSSNSIHLLMRLIETGEIFSTEYDDV